MPPLWPEKTTGRFLSLVGSVWFWSVVCSADSPIVRDQEALHVHPDQLFFTAPGQSVDLTLSNRGPETLEIQDVRFREAPFLRCRMDRARIEAGGSTTLSFSSMARPDEAGLSSGTVSVVNRSIDGQVFTQRVVAVFEESEPDPFPWPPSLFLESAADSEAKSVRVGAYQDGKSIDMIDFYFDGGRVLSWQPDNNGMNRIEFVSADESGWVHALTLYGVPAEAGAVLRWPILVSAVPGLRLQPGGLLFSSGPGGRRRALQLDLPLPCRLEDIRRGRPREYDIKVRQLGGPNNRYVITVQWLGTVEREAEEIIELLVRTENGEMKTLPVPVVFMAEEAFRRRILTVAGLLPDVYRDGCGCGP